MTQSQPPYASDGAIAALHALRKTFSSQQEMADYFGVSQATVSLWLRGNNPLPARHVIKAEARTGISRHFYNPDIYPDDAPSAPRHWHGVDGRSQRVALQSRPVLQNPGEDLGAAA